VANVHLTEVLRHIRTLVTVRAHADHTDRQLLERFAATRDEAAFATLVGRHGPLVFGVCRRILRNAHDAEGAFQATFLVLARKAGSIRWQRSVGSWLYEVATRIAQGIRTDLAREQAHKRATRAQLVSGTFGPERLAGPVGDPFAATAQLEMLSILDEELSRLPTKYLEPVVLCYLEGKSHQEAARERLSNRFHVSTSSAGA
jgi:RNA polymerase sigma factor (sigma-70 family)